MSPIYKWFQRCGTVVAVCLIVGAGAAAEAASDMAKSYAPAAVGAAPGLTCKLHEAGGVVSAGLPVFTDADGYARFLAVRVKPGEGHARYVLDCADAAGKSSAYPVDLSAEGTFAPHPIDLSKEPGVDRPALKGDPLSYSTLELIQKGYGVRPDPKKNPAAYARWLDAASKPVRLLAADKPLLHKHNTVTSSQDGLFTGSVLDGSSKYSWIEATFNAPTAVHGGDETTATEISAWVGLAGNNPAPGGLIQGGLFISTTPTTASYSSFREYCCGDPNHVNYGSSFSPSPGAKIYAQAWYCNSKGQTDLNGGYGCVLVQDMNSGAALSCTSPNGSPCASVKANVLCSASPNNPTCFEIATDADFIIENDTPQVCSSCVQFTDFTPTVVMAGSAVSALSDAATISNDPDILVFTDWTRTTTHMVVALGDPDKTKFTIEAGQIPYAFYCQGPLKTSGPPTPLTRFIWSKVGAGTTLPGPGECAWPDRGPRGTEIKSGNSNDISGYNYISGYLNQFTSLKAGKFMELSVYNDAAQDNDMVVEKIIGVPTMPISSAPSSP